MMNISRGLIASFPLKVDLTMDKDFKQNQKFLARNIKALREKSGLSQEALALTAQVDRTFVSQIERCDANPSLRVLYQISSALKVDLLELVSKTK